jgi:glycosyltransferase involved in cell wall biosynthesis
VRIAFVNHTEKWGGVKTWCLDMAAAFAAAGHSASLYGRDALFLGRAAALGLEAHARPGGMDYHPLSIAAYVRAFRQSGVEAVVVNVGKDVRTAGIAARLLGLPVIRHVGAPWDFRDSLQVRLDHALVRPAFLCCSRYVLEGIVRRVPHVRNFPHAAIHPGTPLPPERPAPENDPPRLVTTSRLSGDKRHADLLGALVLLRGRGFSPALDIVGAGPEEAALKGFVRDNDLEGQVRFHGFSSSVAEYLDRADIFVLPSRCEPLGIALEEGMAHGLVPVARKAGGVPEIWPDGLGDLLLPEEAGPGDFARCLEAILLWPRERRLAVRDMVRRTARERFSRQGQFQAFARWLFSLAGRPAGPSPPSGQAPGSSAVRPGEEDSRPGRQPGPEGRGLIPSCLQTRLNARRQSF